MKSRRRISPVRGAGNYARMFAMLAKDGYTRLGLSEQSKNCPNVVGVLLKRFRVLKLIYVSGFEKQASGHWTPIWRARIAGDELDAEAPNFSSRKKDRKVTINLDAPPPPWFTIPQDMVAFAVAIRSMMEGPRCGRDITAETGWDRSTALRVLKHCKLFGIIHVSAWRRPRVNGSWAPYYEVGVNQKDVPRPTPVSRRQIDAKNWSRRTHGARVSGMPMVISALRNFGERAAA